MTRPEISGNFFNWWEIFGELRTTGARLPAIKVDQGAVAVSELMHRGQARSYRGERRGLVAAWLTGGSDFAGAPVGNPDGKGVIANLWELAHEDSSGSAEEAAPALASS